MRDSLLTRRGPNETGADTASILLKSKLDVRCGVLMCGIINKTEADTASYFLPAASAGAGLDAPFCLVGHFVGPDFIVGVDRLDFTAGQQVAGE